MNKSSILIIDDEEIIRDVLSKDLREAGYDVCVAKDGAEGIKYFMQNQQDLVIVDLVMEGVGGLDVAKSILQLKPGAKIIVLTGYGTRESAIDALRLGVSDFLIKPCDRKILLEKVFEHLENKTSLELEINLDKVFSRIQAYNLTVREEEICRMLLLGKSREEISLTLYISKNTVDTHVKNLYKKMEVSSFPKLLEKILD